MDFNNLQKFSVALFFSWSFFEKLLVSNFEIEIYFNAKKVPQTFFVFLQFLGTRKKLQNIV